jgi:hypothetical protein
VSDREGSAGGRSGGSFGGSADPDAPFSAGRRGAGGTSGGLGEFFGGLALVGVGAYLLLSRVTVHTSFWHMAGGGSAFGVTLLPLLIGIVLLFVNGKSVLGWVLAIAGFGALIVGVVANMDMYFQPTSLTITLMMLALICAGLGLIVRSLRPHR